MYLLANILTGTNRLPNQIIESIGALLIFLILWIVAKRNHYKTKGYLYYIMLILYGSQRFLLEFLRDNNKVIVFYDLKNADGAFGISNLAIWAAAMFIEGVIILYLTIRHDKKRA